jgi:DNA modification methylase
MKDWKNKLFFGDNLDIMREIPDEVIDLIYLDPPFNSNATTYTFADEFELKDEGQEKTYTVAINWPDGENDIDYAGADFGTALAVSVTGTQK